MQTVKAWLIDPLGLNGVQLEVSEKLPQGLQSAQQSGVLIKSSEPYMRALST